MLKLQGTRYNNHIFGESADMVENQSKAYLLLLVVHQKHMLSGMVTAQLFMAMVLGSTTACSNSGMKIHYNSSLVL